MQYFTGFFIEKALSIDNVFVISLIFTYFAIPPKYQYRALLWGIIAVIVLRGIMIAGGAALVSEAYWVLYIFAAFLIVTGIKMFFAGDEPMDIANNPVVRFISQPHAGHARSCTASTSSCACRTRRPGKLVRAATPLFLALVVINLADLVFAVDSVPAIFAITTDTFIVYTSNIMAILGLRALYFALAAMVHRFHYLKYALAVVLVFIGAKIFVADFVLGGDKFPPVLSLGVTLALIAAGILYSLWKTRGAEPVAAPAPRRAGRIVVHSRAASMLDRRLNRHRQVGRPSGPGARVTPYRRGSCRRRWSPVRARSDAASRSSRPVLRRTSTHNRPSSSDLRGRRAGRSTL